MTIQIETNSIEAVEWLLYLARKEQAETRAARQRRLSEAWGAIGDQIQQQTSMRVWKVDPCGIVDMPEVS